MTTESEAGPGIRVEIVAALPGSCWSRRYRLAPGATVAEALEGARRDGIEAIVTIDVSRMAIFSRPVTPATTLRDGDRLEVLRPLTADPKQSRRTRAGERAGRR